MSDFKPMTMEQIKAEADRMRCEVVVAAADELQFDLDSKMALDRFENFFSRLSCHYEGATMTGWKSKSGNSHRVLSHPKFALLTIESRIALQTMGGSDEGREFAALHCLWAGSEHPILLYKPLASTGGAA